MLYKKNSAPALTEELFQNPTAEFRGAPFWAWNTKLKDEALLKQIEIFKQMGIGGFHMHVRSGMATEYLSEEFMRLISLCNEKAKKEDMLCWLYDEDRWPSGAAGGIVTKNYRYRSRSLVVDSTDPHQRKNFAENFEEFGRMADAGEKPCGYFLGRYAVTFDGDGFLKDYRRLEAGEEAAGKVWYAYVIVSEDNPWYNGQAYLDTLNKKAVEEFVRVTYDAYYKAVGKDFGGSIPAIFTDEPQVPQHSYFKTSGADGYITLPFTDDFEDTYKAAYGESLLDKVPELVWEKPEHGCALTRYRYMDHMCERFVSAFVDTIGQWCMEHDIAFTGHMMQEPTLSSQTDSLGEAMRCYRNFQIPGMDLLCDRVELTTAKQVQSAVHQYGREGMLSELYGVTGWDFDFKGHKRQGDWQAALGVTVRVHHLTWVSMNGEAKRDYPASIGYQSPWYKEYSYIENHFARLYTALTRGTPRVRVGVIHPVESFWLYCGPNDKTALRRQYLNAQFDQLTRALAYSGIDFDFIAESLFPQLCKTASNPIAVGEMKYDCLVVPVMETMRATTLERLEAFAKAGGRVILVGKPPEFIDAQPSPLATKAAKNWKQLDVDYTALVDALEEFRFVEFTNLDTGVRCGNFVHQLRKDGEDIWLFFCHGDDMEKQKGFVSAQYCEKVKVTIDGAYDLTEYDTLTGNIYTPAYRIENGKTVIMRTMFAQDSLLLKLTPAKGDKLVEGNAPARAMPKGVNDILVSKPSAKVVMAPAEDELAAADGVPYTLDEPNAVLLDLCEYAFDGEPYQGVEDSLLVADIGRKRFFEKHQGQRIVQPWVEIPEDVRRDMKAHTVKRKFCFYSEIAIENACLALEQAEEAKIWINGQPVLSQPNGWYVDECIQKVPLPALKPGEIVVEVEIPFSLRSCTEWCYFLGNFGVQVQGKFVSVVPLPKTLAFGDAVPQGLPFYTGNITYHTSYIEPAGAERTLQLSRYAGALAKVCVDNREAGTAALAPYCVPLGFMEKGKHCLDITVFGTRVNGFGPVHNSVPDFPYLGPNAWRTHHSPLWSDVYQLHPTGLLSAPAIY